MVDTTRAPSETGAEPGSGPSGIPHPQQLGPCSHRWEDGVALVIAAWLIGGLFLDGYAHAYVIDAETENFFTPWHAVFYAAFTTLAVWVGFVGYRRRRPGRLIDWFPAGYRGSVIGLIVFAVGGIGDGIWHTIFGIEVGLDALLSPTHLVLFVGGILLLWTPVRAAEARSDPRALLPVGAASLTTALLLFAVQYVWLLPHPSWAWSSFDPVTDEGWRTVSQFLGSTIATVAVLLGPLLLVATRWRLPFGAATATWLLAAGLDALAFALRADALWLMAAGGLAFDVAYRFVPRGLHVAVAAAVGPAVAWSLYFVLAARQQPLGWPPEVWAGSVGVAGFTGLGLVLLQRSGARTPITR